MNVAEKIYQQLRQELFDFQLQPGDRFSETEVAKRMNASRTPVREALYRLERDGYVQVQFRNGWQVRPFDFQYFEDLYDVRILLEVESVRRLIGKSAVNEKLAPLVSTWCCNEEDRVRDSALIADMDENFHFSLVDLNGNQQMSAIHREVCERLRIIRRLDFTRASRIDVTYEEHGNILKLIISGDESRAEQALRNHIELSRNTVREITLHRIQMAKSEYSINIKMDHSGA
jgi:DNA-binding GntR family transcriptional regulator